MTTRSSRQQTSQEQLEVRIASLEARIGVIGLGYVGLPLSYALHSGGLEVLGFDIDRDKVEALSAGRSYLKHFGQDPTAELAASARFSATTDFTRLAEMDVVIVCVPTPVGPHQEPDLSYVTGAADHCGRTLRSGQLLILESTTYPGTTRDEFLSAIQASYRGSEHLEHGRDYFVAYSPEREDPGRRDFDTKSIPKLVGGLDPTATRLAASVYRLGVEDVVEVSTAEVAEAAKLLENIFRAVNIAMVNELKTLFQEMDLDIWEVIGAASTKPFGFMPFFPGPGLGGHCIPIDPFYLSWKAKEVGRHTRFIELAGEINTAMPGYVVDRISRALNDQEKSVAGSDILVLGLAYKPNVDDTRESPSFEIIDLLRKLGANVQYSDPHIPKTVPVRRHDLELESTELRPEVVAGFDAVVVATDHDAFDYEEIARSAQLIVDTRNAFHARGLEPAGAFYKA